jgi:Na+/melibiose symporter-like transporter
MNGTDTELRKELWMWRGLMILLMIFLIVTTFLTYLKDKEQALEDESARSKAWTTIITNQDRLRAMIDKNHMFILRVDDQLRACSACHTHPDVKKFRSIP